MFGLDQYDQILRANFVQHCSSDSSGLTWTMTGDIMHMFTELGGVHEEESELKRTSGLETSFLKDEQLQIQLSVFLFLFLLEICNAIPSPTLYKRCMA